MREGLRRMSFLKRLFCVHEWSRWKSVTVFRGRSTPSYCQTYRSCSKCGKGQHRFVG